MSGTVAFVTTIAAIDGPGRALAAVVRALPASWQVHVCSLTTVRPEFIDALGDRPVEVHRLGMRHRFDPRVVPRLRRVLVRVRPDVVHTQLSRADWIGRVVARRLGVPAIVTTVQNLHTRAYPAESPALWAAVGGWLDRATAVAADAIVAVSAGVADDLRRAHVRCERVRVIPNGLDLERRSSVCCRGEARARWGIAPGALVIGTCAALKAQKGLDVLVDAARLLAPRAVPVEVLVFGEGRQRRELEGRMAARGGAARVRLLGWDDEAMRWLRALDVFVLPSRWEGLPSALLEALSIGLPVVATRVAGIEDVLEHGTSGLLVEAEDPRGLARAIDRLVDDPELATRLAAAGQRRVETAFTAARTARMHVDLYQDVLTGGRARGRAG